MTVYSQGFSEVEANRIARKKHKKEIDRAAKAIRDENRRGTTAWTDGSKFPDRTLNAQMEAQYVAAVTNRLFGKSMQNHPSITVLTHGDGSVSVGFSGEMDVNLTDQVFTELTRLQHERGETALNTQYRVSTEGMPKELLTKPKVSLESKSIPPALNNCSEPKAMAAAHGSGEAITGMDTVWRTDLRDGEKHAPYHHKYRYRKIELPWVYEQMGPCRTCKTNKGAYFNYATS